MQQQQRSAPARRTFKDVFIAMLCFGIPYTYANRHAYQHFDAEGGILRSAGPMVVVGASVCIVACFSGFFMVVARANNNNAPSRPLTHSSRTPPSSSTGCGDSDRVSDVPRTARPRPGRKVGRAGGDPRLYCEPGVLRHRRVPELGGVAAARNPWRGGTGHEHGWRERERLLSSP